MLSRQRNKIHLVRGRKLCTVCLLTKAFSITILARLKVHQTYNTFTTWEAPASGTYYVTVVAFNSALEFSTTVCSDGVTVDTTGPVLSDVYVSEAHIAGGVASAYSSEGVKEVWYVDTDRRRRFVDSPDQACM